MYYNCVKFHKDPISRLGGVLLTRCKDGRTGWFLYTPLPPPNYNNVLFNNLIKWFILNRGNLPWSNTFCSAINPAYLHTGNSEHNIHSYRLYNNTINEIPAKVDHTTWFSRHPLSALELIKVSHRYHWYTDFYLWNKELKMSRVVFYFHLSALHP